jgi:uncharacterized phage protein (TIGR01671 family)
MREIKFRGLNENGTWEYTGDTILMDDFWNRVAKGQIKNVGQYTGLKDKNGKKIYEGDIIETETSTGVHIFTVKYDIEKTGYICPYVVDDEYETYIGQLPNSIEIIGNIYENPELLK